MQIKKFWAECADNDGKHYMVPVGSKELAALLAEIDALPAENSVPAECH